MLNNSLIWKAMEMKISQDESLISFLQKAYKVFDFCMLLKEITDEKQSTLKNGVLVHSKKKHDRRH